MNKKIRLSSTSCNILNLYIFPFWLASGMENTKRSTVKFTAFFITNKNGKNIVMETRILDLKNKNCSV